MAIDLFCYSKKSAKEAQELLDKFINQHPEWFETHIYLPNAAHDLDKIGKEVALEEHQIDVNSLFLISYNDKNKAFGETSLQLQNALKEIFSGDIYMYCI